MKRDHVRPFGFAVLAILLIGFATPSLAHHSTVMFDLNKTITIEGTITQIAWGNPHSVMFVDAKPLDQADVPVKNWVVETANPAKLVEMGWQAGTLKVGDKVRVKGAPRKDGKSTILFMELTDDKGHHFVMKSGEAAGK
jgi:hypothetical protein